MAAAPGPPAAAPLAPAPARAPVPRKRRRLGRVLPVVTTIVGLASAGFGAWRLLGSDEQGALPPARPEVTVSPQSTEAVAPVAATDVSLWPTCTNDTLGYELRYPSDWFTFAAHPGEECGYFHSAPFEYETVPSEVAITITAINSDFDDWVASYTGQDIEVVARAETTIAGRRAVHIEFRFPDSPELGLMSTYLIEDPSGTTLIAEAFERQATDFELAKRNLDLMMGTLTFP